MKLTDKFELRTVAYHPELRDITGSIPAAIMLQQLLYWWDRKRGKYIYKTVEEMAQETGLTKHQQTSACKRLEALGFINIHYKGTYKIRHFELNTKIVEDAVDAHVKQRGPLKNTRKAKSQSTKPESGEAVVRKPANMSSEKRTTITEITSKTTNKNLSSTKKPSSSHATTQAKREIEIKSSTNPNNQTLPSWLDETLWQTWLQARNEKFGPTTRAATNLALKELSDLVNQGWPAAQILCEAIARGTPRFYPPCKPGTEKRTLARLKQESLSNVKQPNHNANHQTAHELRQEIQWLMKMISDDPNPQNRTAFQKQLTYAQHQLSALECKAA